MHQLEKKGRRKQEKLLVRDAGDFEMSPFFPTNKHFSQEKKMAAGEYNKGEVQRGLDQLGARLGPDLVWSVGRQSTV